MGKPASVEVIDLHERTLPLRARDGSDVTPSSAAFGASALAGTASATSGRVVESGTHAGAGSPRASPNRQRDRARLIGPGGIKDTPHAFKRRVCEADLMGVEGRSEPIPAGAIFDTNSKGRFDLVLYEDGLLAVKGTYVGVMLRGAGAGMGGAGASWSSGSAYEMKRLDDRLRGGRDQVMDRDPNFFVARASITGLVLRKRWYGHSLTVETRADPQGRRFDWKPKLNRFEQVEEELRSLFPALVARA